MSAPDITVSDFEKNMDRMVIIEKFCFSKRMVVRAFREKTRNS